MQTTTEHPEEVHDHPSDLTPLEQGRIALILLKHRFQMEEYSQIYCSEGEVSLPRLRGVVQSEFLYEVNRAVAKGDLNWSQFRAFSNQLARQICQ